MAGPIRVLHVIGIMNRGGAETMIMNLYRNIDRSKVQFDFVENSSEPAVFDREILALGGKIYRCPHYNGRNHFTYVNWWVRFFQDHPGEYPIVHGHLGSTAAIYLRIAKKNGAYAIAHSHSSGTDHSIKSFLYQVMSYRTRNTADYFFACSEAAGRDRFGEKTVTQKNYSVLNNAIDTRRFVFQPSVREEVRKEFGFRENNIVIGHIGRFTSEKNHAFLLRVFAEAMNQNDSARLLLIGNGPLHQQTVHTAEELGLMPYVTFTGVRGDVERLLQAVDVFTLPSIYEGLPVTLVEAQASGVPCVISDAIPAESVITEGLVTALALDAPVREWADRILTAAGTVRADRTREVKAHGFDIQETAKWLEGFYLGKIVQ